MQRLLTLEEQHQKFGLIRFVLEFNKEELCSWARYKHKSNSTPETLKGMETTGLELGANPDDWYASFKNIPLSKCLNIQKCDGMNWIEYLQE